MARLFDRCEQFADRIVQGLDDGRIERIPSLSVPLDFARLLIEHDVRRVVRHVAEEGFVAVGLNEFDGFVGDEVFVFTAGRQRVTVAVGFDTHIETLGSRC